jgi:hypothetical protein
VPYQTGSWPIKVFIDRLDPCQHRPGELYRRELAGPDELRDFHQDQERELVLRCHAFSSRG